MLFQYPASATTENWLHECLIQILESVNASIQAGVTPEMWPTIIPGDFRERLKLKHGFKTKLIRYQEKYSALSDLEKEQVSAAITAQNRISELLSCACDCESMGDLPATIQTEIRELCDYCFSLLSKLGIRDQQYADIYDKMNEHVCPFCGCECFDAPGAKREDLDHYMDKARYPFAAANLKNIVPMGMKCNQRYKGSADILKKIDGTRRKAFDPYNHPDIVLSLKDSKPFAGTGGRMPEWQIDFSPNTEEIETWDNIFEVRERYKRDVLDKKFFDWITECHSFCKRASIPISSKTEILAAIDRYALYLEDLGLADRSFLKTAAFHMVQEHSQGPDDRFFIVISDIIRGEASVGTI